MRKILKRRMHAGWKIDLSEIQDSCCEFKQTSESPSKCFVKGVGDQTRVCLTLLLHSGLTFMKSRRETSTYFVNV